MGNEIHAALMVPIDKTDGTYQMDVYHVYLTVKSPRSEAVAFASPTSTVEANATPTSIKVEQPTITSYSNTNIKPITKELNIPLLASIPVILLLMAILLFRARSK